MNCSLPIRFFHHLRHRGVPARFSSLLMLLQRSPLLKLLPETRVISTSGFTDALSWAVAAIAGLGAFDSVSGVTNVSQVTPSSGSTIVSVTGGSFLNFTFSISGAGGHTPYSFQVVGTLPAGLVQTGQKNSKTDFIAGRPLQSGNYPITITAWESVGNTGRSASGSFTLVVSNPPAPTITTSPAGGNFHDGDFVSLSAVQTNGFTFTWKKDTAALPAATTTLVSATAPRRYSIPSTTVDPGIGWRTGAAFDDTTWKTAAGGIGYDTNTTPVNYLLHIDTTNGNVQSQMSGAGMSTSVYLRIPFTMTGNTPISALSLRVKSDDGFVAWLNGTEVASQNKPASLAWNSASGADAVDADAIVFRTINLSSFISTLRAGENILAVQGLNTANTSSDFLFNCELLGGIDATNTTRLIIPAVQRSDAGSYTLTATNPTTSTVSTPAVIVLPPTIGTQPQSVSIPAGTTTSLTVDALVSPPWAYQWYRGTSPDTSSPVAGATARQFTTPALTQTEKYWVRVTNPAGSADSTTATVTVLAVPPRISTQPVSLTIDAGAAAQLNVIATGTGPFSYQWYAGTTGHDTSPIPAAIAADFTTPALLQNANYWVRVTTTGGTADSSTAAITIRDPFLTWQNSNFSPGEITNPDISGPAADADGDGVTNDREYIFGTQPKNPEPAPQPSINGGDPTISVTFIAKKADGAGYAGRTRHYAIETTNDLTAGQWTTPPLYSDITGDDQTVTCDVVPGTGRNFCRLRVWLTP